MTQDQLDIAEQQEDIPVSNQGVFKKVFVKEFLLKVLLPGLAVILFVNTFYSSSENQSTNEAINKALGSGNYQTASEHFRKLIEKDFSNIHSHRGYINAQLDMSKSGSNSKNVAENLYHEYMRYADSPNQAISDIGYYGLGYIHVTNKEYEQGLQCYLKIQYRNMPFLNNSIGYVYNKLNVTDKAKEYFYREIEIDGINKGGASSNLAKLLYEQRDFTGLNDLIANPDCRKYIPTRIIRVVDLLHGRFWKYLTASFHYKYVTGTGVAAALLILAAWFNYLRRIDVFEKEKLRYMLVVLVIGMIFSELCTILYDFMDYGIDLKINGNILNDLIYCVFGIGLIEETVKIVPFLLMLKFSRQVNESIDYVIYAAIPALGFAFMENIMYFQGSGVQNIAGRTLTAVVLHMSMTSIAMYGLFYSKYRKNNQNRILYFACSFFAAMILHGVYDFILICEKVPSDLRIVSLLILFLSMSKFSLIIRNALNVSEYNVGQKGRIENLSRYLVYSLSGVILLQYVLMARKFGAENTNTAMLGSLGSFYFIMFIIVAMLGNIRITKSKWHGLFDQNSSEKRLNDRAARTAKEIGVDWELLKGKYGRWETWIGLSLFSLAILIASIYTLMFWGLSRLLHPAGKGDLYVILPAWPIWILPSLFLGIVTAVLGYMIVFKKMIGEENYKEYELYDRLKNGPYGKKIFLTVSVLIVIVCAVFLPLSLDHYVRVNDEGVTLSRFKGFGEKLYSYDQIRELRQVLSQKDEAGNITHQQYFEIQFDDNFILTFQHNVFNFGYDRQYDMVSYVSDQSSVKVITVDPYPEKG